MLTLKLENGNNLICDDENNTFTNNKELKDIIDENGKKIEISNISEFKNILK